MVKAKFTTDFPEVVLREEADELKLRREEGMLRTFIDTTNVGKTAPLVDEDWHAISQAIYKRRRGTGMGEHVR